jgi:hypothetical protein
MSRTVKALCAAAAVVDTLVPAAVALTTLENKYAPSWGGNWYDDEAGWFILAATATNP